MYIIRWSVICPLPSSLSIDVVQSKPDTKVLKNFSDLAFEEPLFIE